MRVVAAGAVLALVWAAAGASPARAECTPMDTNLGPCAAANVRYAATSNKLYVTGPVACTLTDLSRTVPETVLARVPGRNTSWLLRAHLLLTEGAMLKLHGPSLGGDVDQLRLMSNPGDHVSVRATWGTIDIRGTRITSWDEGAQAPDEDYEDGRAFMGVQSYLEFDVARQGRMNVIASEVSYLGFPAGESYGLAWKVSGTGISGEDSPIFNHVDVLGDVRGSRLHHNYYAVYTWGGYCMVFDNNEVDHNVGYGLDYHDNTDLISVTNNNVHDNGLHGIICSKNCDRLTIVNNRAYRNGRHGIMLHRFTNQSLVQGNSVWGNLETGIAVFDSYDNVIRGNDVWSNLTGIHVYIGSSRNLIERNLVHANTAYGILFKPGTDPAWTGDNTPRDNVVQDNFIYGNAETGLTAGSYAEQVIKVNSLEPPPPGTSGNGTLGRRAPIVESVKLPPRRSVARPHP